MNLTAFNILVVLSIILAVVGLVKPQWLTTAVAVLLLAIAVLIGPGR